MVMALHLARTRHRSLTNPSLINLFSTSSSPPNDPNLEDTNSSNDVDDASSLTKYFRDVKASLKQKREHEERATSHFQKNPTNPYVPSSRSIRNPASLEEIHKNLSEFHRRSAAPPPTESSSSTPSQSQTHISFQELYKRNVLAKPNEPNGNVNANANPFMGRGRKLSLEAIKESLQHMRSNNESNNVQRKDGQTWSSSTFTQGLRMRPADSSSTSTVIGGTGNLPSFVFGKEINDKKREAEGSDAEAMKIEFLKNYSYMDLGKKLRQLRPEQKEGEGWFSLQELNERLMKLREMEEKESRFPYKDIREGLATLKMTDAEMQKRANVQRQQRIDILGTLSGTSDYKQHPPKEHLLEKYFHPDNMSSAEKLKIELAQVRDEFKMSESDCGSARVQVAQLTTKIKHLSSVLHKKDKHSRKGLQGMVQQRKKLLKYLRRTDWESYSFVLEKLGLRDNPDYKN